jgi:hypothetical protein
VQLQAVCARLWSHLPRDRDVIGTEDVDRYGNVEAALIELYEEAIAKAVRSGDAGEASVREWFARELITPMRTRGTVVQKKRDTGGLPNTVVAVLETEHLVRAEQRAGARWYELAHDLLIDPILSSNERWLGSEANQLTRLAAEWERLGRDRGALLRGRKLDELGKWAEGHGGLLGLREQEFLRLSRAARWAERLRLTATALGPFVPLALALYALIAMWPAVVAATAAEDPVSVLVFGLRWRPDGDVALLTMVALAAAVGGLARATVSIADYAWNPSASFDRVVMHVLYALAGVALAVTLYFAIRGGLMHTTAFNPYGLAALSGLVGLFAAQTMGKLRQVFDVMFGPVPPEADRPRPALHSVLPLILEARGAALDLELRGEGFAPDSVGQVQRPPAGPEPRATKYLDPGRLRLRLLPEDVAKPGRLEVTVLDLAPDGGSSEPLGVEIREPAVADVPPELLA